MIIKLYPMRRDDPLTVRRDGDVLTLNDVPFDFSTVPEGATLPREAIDSLWFAGDVERINGRLHIKLLLPHGQNAPYETRFPEPLFLEADGPIALPAYEVADD